MEQARAEFRTTIAAGTDVEAIITAARRRADRVTAGEELLRFVPSAMSWLHDGGWRDVVEDRGRIDGAF